MIRLYKSQLELWDTILPEELRRLPEHLAFVDALLDDERFMEPFMKKITTTKGRPTIPMERYLRIMYLKFNYGMGYETLVKELSDSLQWRRFCRIGISERVPHSTTLIKLTRRMGADVMKELNNALTTKACEAKLIRGRKLQTDTTVVEADIHYPTDAGLLADGVRALSRTIEKVKELGHGLTEGFRRSTRKMKSCLRAIGSLVKSRTGQMKEQVEKVTAEALQTAERVVKEAKMVGQRIARFAKRTAGELSLQAVVLSEKLADVLQVTGKIIGQTHQRLAGITAIPDRLVSIFDRDARPLRRGLKSKPVEFGYKVQFDEIEGGFISSYETYKGNPGDVTLLLSAVERHSAQFGRVPEAVATDRGFYSPSNERALLEKGVKKVALPARGKKSDTRKKHEKQSCFKRLQRWRAGGEATISRLKRRYCQRRSLYRGYSGASTWVGFGVLANNIARFKMLHDAKNRNAVIPGDGGQCCPCHGGTGASNASRGPKAGCTMHDMGGITAMAGVN